MLRRALLSLLVWAGFCGADAAEEAPAPRRGDVVLWLSLDGLRSDYLERAETPELQRLIKDGVHSRQLEPVFPAVTFPSHISQATGVRVAQHGIPSNKFFDAATGKEYQYPQFGDLLEAEPIWTTATRQGVRVCVHDWPLSHRQRGKLMAAYSEARFDGAKSDAERLKLLLDTWDGDASDQPLRLLMGYIVGTDKVGHERGPDSREVLEVMTQVDALVGETIARAVKIFDKQRRGDEQLYVLLTTDHGMSTVHTLVNLPLLAGVSEQKDVRTLFLGNMGDLFFAKENADRETLIADAMAKVNATKFCRAYRREELPKEWGLAHPTRVGDVVCVLERGYSFSKLPPEATMPVDERGPYGMHGYDPRDNPEMLGPLVVWRHPRPLPPRDLGPVHSLQLHTTVAKLLGIDAAEGAKEKPFEIEPSPKRLGLRPIRTLCHGVPGDMPYSQK